MFSAQTKFDSLLGKLNNQPLRHQIIMISLSLVIFAIFCLYNSERLFTHLGKQSIADIENALEQTRSETKHILNQISAEQSCTQLAPQLRQTVFMSDYAKEIGVFKGSPTIYCTSTEGYSQVEIYSTIFDRVAHSPTHETLAFTRTAITKQNSILYIYSDSQLNGVSMVIPPRYLTRLINGIINQEHLIFDIKVYQYHILGQDHQDYIKSMVFNSDVFPLQVEFYLTAKTYISYLLSKIWVLLCIYFSLLSCYLYKRKIVIQKKSLESSILHALEAKQFEVYFQPIVQSSDRSVAGCEALLRWNHPTQGFIPPNIFIPLAERLGFIEQLTDFVIDEACALYEHHPQLMQGKYVSVNIARELMCSTAFTDKIIARCINNPAFSQNIAFEITEDGDFSDSEQKMVERNFRLLSHSGMRLFVDDFGTGYSGLNFVRQFHFDTLKIDQVFVKNLGHEPHLNNVLISMLQLAASLRMRVIVEGVETQEQLAILNQLGVDYIQGYLFSKPLPQAQWLDYLSHCAAKEEQESAELAYSH